MQTLSLDQAVAKIPDGASLMIGGFMAVGTPERAIDELVRQSKRDLTVIANDTAMPGRGIGKLVDAKLLRKAIVSHIGLNPETQRQMMAGELEVELVPQGTLVERIRAGIARSFQLVNLFDQMSVLDNVALTVFSREGKTGDMFHPAEGDGAVRDEALAVLRQFGLHAKADTLASELAQGERKLLDVAVACALRPRLLFLDEPTSGVSTREKAPIMDIVTSIVRSGAITAVIIEHDMDVVFRYSDRIVAMHQGRILADGTPDAIRANDEVAMTLLGEHVHQ